LVELYVAALTLATQSLAYGWHTAALRTPKFIIQ